MDDCVREGGGLLGRITGGKGQFKRHLTGKHADTCIEVPVECPFKVHGCNAQLKRSGFAQHQVEYSLLAARYLDEVKTAQSKALQLLDRAMTSIKGLEQTVTTMERQVYTMDRQVKYSDSGQVTWTIDINDMRRIKETKDSMFSTDVGISVPSAGIYKMCLQIQHDDGENTYHLVVYIHHNGGSDFMPIRLCGSRRLGRGLDEIEEMEFGEDAEIDDSHPWWGHRKAIPLVLLEALADFGVNESVTLKSISGSCTH